MINSLFKVFPKVIKNTLINYIKNLINYIILESFPDVGKNTVIDWNENIVDYIGYLINYRRL